MNIEEKGRFTNPGVRYLAFRKPDPQIFSYPDRLTMREGQKLEQLPRAFAEDFYGFAAR